MAVIKIQREKSFADKIRDYKVFIDNIQVGTISESETKEFHIEEGKHIISIKIDWAGSQEIKVDIKENETITLLANNYSAKHWLVSVYYIIFVTLLHLFLKYSFEFQYSALLFIPSLAVMTYYLTIGRNKYLTLTTAKPKY